MLLALSDGWMDGCIESSVVVKYILLANYGFGVFNFIQQLAVAFSAEDQYCSCVDNDDRDNSHRAQIFRSIFSLFIFDRCRFFSAFLCFNSQFFLLYRSALSNSLARQSILFDLHVYG